MGGIKPKEPTIIGGAGWRAGFYHAAKIFSSDFENRITHRLYIPSVQLES